MWTSVWICVFSLRVSSVAELSRSDSKVDDDGEGDDLRVELLSVQLINPHWAGFLEQKGTEKKCLHHLHHHRPPYLFLLQQWYILGHRPNTTPQQRPLPPPHHTHTLTTSLCSLHSAAAVLTEFQDNFKCFNHFLAAVPAGFKKVFG